MKLAKFLFLLSSLTGVVGANLAFESVAHAESERLCRQYAKVAVDAFRQNEALGCRFSNARWQSNADAHFNWCRTAPAQWLKNEEEFRANQLRVCRSDSKAVSCNGYAMRASGDQQSNLSGRCGFTGPRWQDNEDEHLRWCLQAPVEAVNSESIIRFAMLGVCGGEPNFVRCDKYARQAVAQGAEATARGCGVSGPQWTASSYEGHLTWCTGQPQNVAESEAREREGPLSLCRTINPLPGGTVPPAQETCSWSVTVKNQTCLNLDSTPSSIIAGSLSAPGCGSNRDVALQRAKLNFASSVGCLSEGNSATPGCCTYSQQTTQGCLCR